ncbi:unnamed protein product [Lupinus luteus]|uniref:Uncharacterized protein n=1 Tax=Lupinus luteus TaxID=3873 RepID=A0AAV1XW86_LUPLU
MFSPTGKSTLLQGERSNLEEVITKFAQLSPQERAKRKLESLEVLKKTFKKLDHDVKIQDFLGSSYWSNVDKINNLEHLRQMEDSLRESMNRVCLQKENLGKNQLLPLGCSNQEGMNLPMMMAGLQESQPLSWLLNNDNHHQLILPNEPKFLAFSDNTNRDAECSTEISLPGYSGYNIGNNKLEVGNSPQVTTLGHGGSALNELNGTASLNIQHCEQFAYPPHPPEDEEMKHHQAMNSKPNTADYQIHNNFDLPRSLFENGHQFWNSGPGPCGIAMYNDNGFHRVSKLSSPFFLDLFHSQLSLISCNLQ